MRKAIKYDALQLANDLVKWPYERYEAAAELRRLHAENEALREANEAFGKRQEWWNEKMVALEAINAELVEALRGLSDEVERFGLHHPDGNSNWWPVTLEKAQAALAKVEKSK